MDSLFFRFGTVTFLAWIAYVKTTSAQVNTYWNDRTSSGTNSQTVTMIVDDAGNSYTTGASVGSGTGYDYLTTKLAPEGTHLWSARYDNGGDEKPAAIALDKAGNVYVTGNNPLTNDITTIKYSSDGVQLWVRHYNGPSGGTDSARAIAVDFSGNIYVTGQVYEGTSGWSVLTLKYDGNGTQLWANRYSGGGGYRDPRSMILDSVGNIYVAGPDCLHPHYVAPEMQVIILKYAPNGTLAGTISAGFNQNGVGDDANIALATGNAGELYCAVSLFRPYAPITYNMLKFTNNVQQWWKGYCGASFPNYSTTSRIQAMTTDGVGNMFVTGYSLSNSYDFATVKLDADGNQLWAARYDGPGHSDDLARAIALDKQGNVYVTGSSVGTNNIVETATIKYGPGGTQLWVKRTGNPNGPSAGTGIALDAAGNLFTTGYTPSLTLPNKTDYFTSKYVQWGRSLSVLPNGHVLLKDIATADCTNRIQYSTNLLDWKDLSLSTSDSAGTTVFEDAPTSSHGFYRFCAP